MSADECVSVLEFLAPTRLGIAPDAILLARLTGSGLLIVSADNELLVRVRPTADGHHWAVLQLHQRHYVAVNHTAIPSQLWSGPNIYRVQQPGGAFCAVYDAPRFLARSTSSEESKDA
eukprot:838972-Amphidinium_carterae.1